MPMSRTIVVVENESLLRDLIARSLEAAGFEVSTAANAADAKRAVKAADPDVCVIDIDCQAVDFGKLFRAVLIRLQLLRLIHSQS